jgi:hypothetical protein
LPSRAVCAAISLLSELMEPAATLEA